MKKIKYSLFRSLYNTHLFISSFCYTKQKKENPHKRHTNHKTYYNHRKNYDILIRTECDDIKFLSRMCCELFQVCSLGESENKWS